MIYCDYNADTPLDPRVLEAMLPIYRMGGANPSSTHQKGRKARALIEKARQSITHHFKAQNYKTIFVSGATEGMNTLLNNITTGHIISSALEHSCSLQALQLCESKGLKVTLLRPYQGLSSIKIEQIIEALQADTVAFCFSWVNHETGVRVDIEKIRKLALERNITFFIDAASAVGKMHVELQPGITGLCFSGHKCYGPEGIGCLMIDKNYCLKPLIVGGEQEFKIRAGSEPVAAIVGLAEAVSLINPVELAHIEHLRNHFEAYLHTHLEIIVHGKQEERLGHVSYIAFIGIDAAILMMRLDSRGVCCSFGSACSTGLAKPSHVLLAMGVDVTIAQSSLRFSFGRFTTLEEIQALCHIVVEEVQQLKKNCR